MGALTRAKQANLAAFKGNFTFLARPETRFRHLDPALREAMQKQPITWDHPTTLDWIERIENPTKDAGIKAEAALITWGAHRLLYAIEAAADETTIPVAR
jgi:hypothetical protein